MASGPQRTPTSPPPGATTRDIDLTLGTPGHDAVGPTHDVHATISVGGDLSGQVAVGSNIVQMQIGTMYGNVVTTAPAGAAPTVTPRPRPVRMLPRVPSGFVDRGDEMAQVVAALLARDAVSITGPPGVGKSMLLRSIAHHPQLDAMAAGVVHLSAFDETPADLGQSLFDVFYETSGPYKPSAGEVRHRLHDMDAAILLDDVTWSGHDAGRVLDTLPAAGFALASTEPVVAHEVRLRDLPSGAAPSPVDDLGEEERRVLGVLTAVSGLALDERQVAAAAALDDPQPVLARLAEHGLVVQRAGRDAHDRFGAAAGAQRTLPDRELYLARATLDEHLLEWGLRHRHTVRVDPNEVDAAVTVMHDAARRGRWPLVIALAQAVESSLSLAGRWDAWGETLERLNRAAEQLGVDDVRAFALHQQGALAACTGDIPAATALLQEALQIREVIGDRAGAEVTRASLETVTPPPPPPPPPPPRPPTPSPTAWATILLGTIAGIAVVVGALYAVGVLPLGDTPGDLVIVPAVTGLTEDEALAELGSVGLIGNVTTVQDDAPADTVVDQDPDAGVRVDPDSAVSLFVAAAEGGSTERPESSVEVPGVVGEHVEDAVAILDGVGLSAETVTVEGVDLEPGTVVEQDPLAGELVDPDTTVTLSVAQLPVVTVPSIVGRLVPEAAAIVTGDGLEPGQLIEAGAVFFPSETFDAVSLDAGTVVEQRPTAGSEATAGSPVDMVVLAQDSVIVPPVEELRVGDAVRELSERGLEHESEWLQDREPTCSVVSQDPDAGAIVPVRSVVRLQLSECPVD